VAGALTLTVSALDPLIHREGYLAHKKQRAPRILNPKPIAGALTLTVSAMDPLDQL